jgi:hypothetical protein
MSFVRRWAGLLAVALGSVALGASADGAAPLKVLRVAFPKAICAATLLSTSSG